MTDGLVLAETTPGPLIIVVAFVGYMAGYNQFHSMFWAAIALWMTAFYFGDRLGASASPMGNG